MIKTSKRQNKCFEYIGCHEKMFFLYSCSTLNWLSYQRDKLRISQNTNTWIKQFKTQSCQELSRRCTSMSNWYSASGWALCSLLGILWWNNWKRQWPCMFPVPVSCAINAFIVPKRHFLLWLCKIQADAWFSYFFPVLECAFAEIEDIGIALPNGARSTLD